MKSNVKKNFAFSVVITLILVALYAGALFYILRTAKDLSQVYQDLQSEQKRESDLKNLSQFLKETGQGREVLNDYFIGANGVVNFISMVETLGARTGAHVTIANVGIVPRDGDTTFETLSIEISATGGWASVYHTFELIERMPYALSVKQVLLEEESDPSFSGWHLVMELNIVKLKDNESGS